MLQLNKKHQKYEKYNPTNIDWIGDIPDGWEARRMKTLLKDHSGGVWGDEPLGNEGDIACVRVADFDYKKLSTNQEIETIRNIQPIHLVSKRLTKNSILIEKSGGGEKTPVGRTIRYKLDNPAVCSNFVEKVELKKETLPDFFVYLNCAMYGTGLTFRSIKQTTGIQNLDLTNYFSEGIFLPSFKEQENITNYLDEKTNILDEAIAKKKNQIELLSEHRTALINDAITKGLDKNVEMINSGIDWIGDIPDNWEVKKLKNSFSFEKGKNAGLYTQEYINSDENKGDYPVYSGQTGNEGVMGYINTFIYDEEKAIFTTTVGAKVMTPMLLNGKFSLSQNCVLFKKTTNDVDERYFYYQLFPLFQRQKDDIPSHMQPSLRIGDLNKYVVVYPPFEEQQAIADYLDKEMKYINDMIAKIEKSIELLEEYKTSLISHAVSGKIRIS